MNQTTLDEKLNFNHEILNKHNILLKLYNKRNYSIETFFKKLSLASVAMILVFTIVTQVFIAKTDFKVETYAQDIVNISDITGELSNNRSRIEEVKTLSAEFNERQVNYFEDEENLDIIKPQKEFLVDYKEALKVKIAQQEEENRRIEEERIKREEEKKRLEEEAEAERARIEAQEALEAKQAAEAEAEKIAQEQAVVAQSTPQVTYSGTKYDWMRQAGVAEADFTYVDYILTKESGWRHTVWNTAGSGAYGLCQSLPATKMASAGADYMTNPITQLKWCNGYAQQRYGGWANAYSFWLVNSWW